MKKTIVAFTALMFASVSHAGIGAWSGSDNLTVIAEPNSLVQAFNSTGKLVAEGQTNEYGRVKLKVARSQQLSLNANGKTRIFQHRIKADDAR